jgi:protein SCO1
MNNKIFARSFRFQDARLILFFCLAIFYACKNGRSNKSLPIYNTPDLTPRWLSEEAIPSDSIHHIAPFRFTNQLGETVSDSTLKGKIYVANFFFSICPGICPKMTNNLSTVQKAFASDPEVLLISHSVMPWVDSVAQLRVYGENYDINPQKWHLLTGEAGKIYDLARKSYFAEAAIGYGRDSTEFLHTEHVLLVDGEQRLRGVYNGTLVLEIERLIEDIGVLKKEGDNL